MSGEESIDLTPGDVWSNTQLEVVRHLVARLHRAEQTVTRVRELIAGDIDTPHECTPMIAPIEIADALDGTR